MHRYHLQVTWTGNRGPGTSGYRDYDRQCLVTAAGKPELLASADKTFRGDAARWNPEELLVAALSECHLLSYLHVAAEAGVIVHGYTDDASGSMETNRDGSGQFVSVLLRPRVEVAAPEMIERAQELHERAHELCFIARSVNFPVECEPQAVVRP